MLVNAAARIAAGQLSDGSRWMTTSLRMATAMNLRGGYKVPDRTTLPGLSEYVYPEVKRRIGPDVIVGNVETARGCRFACTYCSIFATTRQKVTVFPGQIVAEDIAQVVKLGATHICFADAEFLNAPGHALQVVARLHETFPDVTFDFTSRADLIAADPGRIANIVACGGRFVTTAFEFPRQDVLDAINKQMSVQALGRALEVCRAEGLAINPTFLLFNPWSSFEDIEYFSEFLAKNGLEHDVDPVQLGTRLWLYKGSPLLERADVRALIVKENEFNYEWRHADPDVERLFALQADQPVASGTVKRCCLKC